MKSKTWCINPYINLSTTPKGNCQVCCMSMDDITNAAGDSACVKDTPIAEIWNMPLRHEIIADMEAGLYHKNCKLCWLEEEGGRRSKRMRDNELYSDVDVSTVQTPLSLDLKLGNLCNIKCRTCNSGSSSSWLKEEYDLLPYSKGSLQDYSSRPGYRDIKLSYDADNDNFWKSLKTLLPGVKSMDIYGGEPMYIKKHWELLDYCVQNGYSQQQTLHYNSNGTIFPEEKIETLNKFKKVNIQFSIDGINDRAEYLRYPAKWTEVIDNGVTRLSYSIHESAAVSSLAPKSTYTNFNYNLSGGTENISISIALTPRTTPNLVQNLLQSF